MNSDQMEVLSEYYTIISNNTIRSFSKFNISITTYGNHNPVQMKIGVKSSNYDNHQIIDVEPLKTQMITLNIEKLVDDKYKLYAEALNGFDNFKKEADLNFNLKELNIFFQTDKAMYKPGDCVKFRVLFLDCNLKMYETKRDIIICIKDSDGNRVKQWKNVEPVRGVFTSDFQLSTNPLFGQWYIDARVDDIHETKTFEVAEYVLPKFSVNINTTPKVCIYDNKMIVTVTANYTNGQPVHGELVITAKNENYNQCGRRRFGHSFEFVSKKTVQFNGKHVQEYALSDLNINEKNFNPNVIVKAVVTEKLTEKKAETQTTIRLQTNRYEISIKGESDTIKPGLPYYANVFIKNIDDSPVNGEGKEIKIFYNFNVADSGVEETLTKNFKLNNLGTASLKFDIPPNTNFFQCKAKYEDEEYDLNAYPNETGKSFIQVRVLTEKLSVGKEIECEIQSTDNLNYFTYQIIGRGNVIYSNTVPVANEKFGKFQFLSTFDMVPNCKLIVYFYGDEGEFVTDTLKLDFPSVFQNKIDIGLSKHEAKPGEDIDLIINTHNDSFVGLLGVDQSVLLLKSGNDLDGASIFKTLEKQMNSDSNYGWYGRQDFKLFRDAGAAIITNIKPKQEIATVMYCAAPGRYMKCMAIMDSEPEYINECLYSGGSNFNRTKTTVRTKFPETWIFDNVTNCSDGMILKKKVPDTITSWILTGFSIDPVLGFGITEQPSKLTVFQPFFVSLNLPYSIKCGEYIEIQVLVFNYMSQNLTAEVTFDNSKDDFDFKENDKENKFRTKIVNIDSNNGSSVKFMVRAKRPGYKTIKVQAITPISGDAIEKELLVEPDGITKYGNKAFLIDLREHKEFSKEILLDIPEDIIPDSTRVDVSIIGDVLGPVVENLDKLIKLPSGCGEQNMLNFVPNIVVLDYFISIKKLTESIKLKAIKFLEKGYQTELTYKHYDGSFSAFGSSDEFGSTWLTAFVVKSFQQAARYIDIDNEILNESLNWLCEQQSEDGSFVEKGKVLYKGMQGGGGAGISLTSYVLTAFLQSEEIIKKYTENIQKALDYILKNISDKVDDIYSLIVTTYAMQLCKHSKAPEFMEKLKSKAILLNDCMHWENPNYKEKEEKNYCSLYDEPSSINVELTSYALLCYVESNMITEAIPIMKWLIGQRNKEGGFSSTQDTIMGIEALSKIAGHFNTNNTNIKLSALQENNESATLNIDSENVNVLQSYQLSPDSRKIKISASGNGVAVGQISYKYNITQINKAPSFNLDVKSEKKSANLIVLIIKANYIQNLAENDLKSNMAVMEIKFPSGFIFEKDTMDELRRFDFIRKIETKDSDTIVLLYFDNLDEKEISMNVCGQREHIIEEQKPAPIAIYDYYDNTRRANIFYEI